MVFLSEKTGHAARLSKAADQAICEFLLFSENETFDPNMVDVYDGEEKIGEIIPAYNESDIKKEAVLLPQWRFEACSNSNVPRCI